MKFRKGHASSISGGCSVPNRPKVVCGMKTRLNSLNKEIESLDAQRTKLNSELETMIQEISLDEKI